MEVRLAVLSHYVNPILTWKYSIEEIIAQALVGGSGRRAGLREIWRKRVVITSRAMLVLLSALTCFIYLHGKFSPHDAPA